MKMTNQTYDQLKWLALIFFPALAAFMGGIGEVYALDSMPKFVTLINLLAAFLGSILQVSAANYDGGGGYGGAGYR